MGLFSFATAIATTPLLPAWAVISRLHPRLRGDWRQRWGLELPPVLPGCVWIHAASMGEVAAAEALVHRLDLPVLLTADTDTGVQRARALTPWSGVRPVDHPLALAPLWAEARPRALIFIEGAWWPQLASRAKAAGIPIVRVNGRAASRAAVLHGAFTRATHLVIAKDEQEASWFRRWGWSPVVVGGELKGDRPLPPNPLTWQRPFVVGASTRPGDEEALLACDLGDNALLLAPRHPNRFDEVAQLLFASTKRWVRRSMLADGTVPVDADIVLLDTVGELGGCLRGARAAFIGGTFDADIGGHSPAEAARAGATVVAGPHVRANRTAFEAIPHTTVDDREELGPALLAAAAEDAEPWSNGAADATMAALQPFLDGPPAPETSPRPWAAPLTVPFALGAGMRSLVYDVAAARKVPVPVVSVGSTNARGSGKTPTTRWAAMQLQERGHTVGIVVRGYGRTVRGWGVRLSSHDASPAALGDEGSVHARDFLVAASPDRVAAAQALVDAGATAIVVDDGLQYRRLHRDLDIVVVDVRYPGARGLQPMGERREWSIVPRRASHIVSHHGDGDVAAHRRPGPWFHGDDQGGGPEGSVLAFAGIGRPADFLADLQEDGLEVEFVPLADHQPIDGRLAAELRRRAGERPLVCTAKDRVRLPDDLAAEVWWRDVEVHIDATVAARWFEALGPDAP